MAEITGQGQALEDPFYIHTWAALGNGDTGRPLRRSGLSDKTVQVFGTFGAGGSVSLQGSMDNVNWETLSDPLGSPLAFSGSGVGAILENTRFIRPSVTAGDGTTSLTVVVGASTLK